MLKNNLSKKYFTKKQLEEVFQNNVNDYSRLIWNKLKDSNTSDEIYLTEEQLKIALNECVEVHVDLIWSKFIPKRKFEIVLIGNRYTGKTTYINLIKNGVFNVKYNMTEQSDIYELEFITNYGKYDLTIWDTPGTNAYKKLDESHLSNADAYFAFYSCNKQSYRNIGTNNIVKKFLKKNPEAEIVNLINFCEDESWFEYIVDRLTNNRCTFRISCKTLFNLTEPILHILRSLSDHSDLKFI